MKRKYIKDQYRQGDVLLNPVKSIPKEAKVKDKTIAYGEITGHSHRFESQSVVVVEVPEGIPAGTDGYKVYQYAEVMKPSELIHEEHGNHNVDISKQEVRLQREFDILEGIRQVMD